MTANYDALDRLSRTAERLRRAAGGDAADLPSLFFFTDPARIADPTPIVAKLPPGAGVVYRAFGRADAFEQGSKLRDLARARGVAFLVGADPALAFALEADGLHAPERSIPALPRLVRRRRFRWVTAAAHSRRAAQAACDLGADAVFLSPVFKSASASAGPPLGLWRASSIARTIPTRVIALGGVRPETAKSLIGLGFWGVAAVDAFVRPDVRTSSSTRT